MLGDAAQLFQIARERRDATHIASDRLYDHRGNAVAVLLENRFETLSVVKWNRDGRVRKCRGDAGSIRQTQSRESGSRLYQERIDVAVIAAFKLDGNFTSSEATRQANRAHTGFGAGVHQPHHFDRWDRINDQLCQFHFASGRRAETGTNLKRLCERIQHWLRAMPEQQRTPRIHIIDVLVSIHIEKM
jgi:hypothetical protein